MYVCCYRYRVFAIDDPYITFSIKIVVQQLEHFYNMTTKKDDIMWKPIGTAIIGPQVRGSRIKDKNNKDSPEVYICTCTSCIYHDCEQLIY